MKQVIHLPFDVALKPGYQIPLDCTNLLASTKLHITFEGHPWDDDYYGGRSLLQRHGCPTGLQPER